jgi:predicted AlkP superfamily phosphohydrolase/phosphomutase
MKAPVIAIGLDAADPVLLDRWMSQGRLENLAALRERGASCRLTTYDFCRAESSNTAFLTGCAPMKSGHWSAFKFDAASYGVSEIPYDYQEYPPFYALGDDYRVAVFDMPQTALSEGVSGVQVLAWGGHSPRSPSHSRPAELFGELVAAHGEHPLLNKDHVSSLGNMAEIRSFKKNLEAGIERRVRICRDLLRRERWDLFLTYFGETHSSQHFMWHLSQPDHPLYGKLEYGDGDPLLEVFEAVDRGVGEILAEAPPDARVIVFADHGMEANNTDLPSLVFLPELLYRFSFPGRRGLAGGDTGSPPPPPVLPPSRRSWHSALWGLKDDPNTALRFLRQKLPTEFFHYYVEKRLGIDPFPACPEDCPLGHQPPMWYSPQWSEMKAFALPSFSEGYVRINLKGREAAGVVDPSEYDEVCDQITRLLMDLTNARTGTPSVRRVVRTRTSAADTDPRLPDADLIVLWRDEPSDVVDSPSFGRIGPVPYYRSGSHVHRGFMVATGPGIAPGTVLPEGHALDLAPTILRLMDAPIPEYFDGKSLIKTFMTAAMA